MRGLSPALKPRFLLISLRFFWVGLRPRFSTCSHRTLFFFGLVLLYSLRFCFSLTRFEPIFEEPDTLHILSHSRSLRFVVVTVAIHCRSHCCRSISDLTVADPSPIWSYPVSDLKVGIFPPFLVSYSITVSRVLKITPECRFIDDFSQIEIDLVLKNIDLCLASTPLMPICYSFLNFRYFFFTISWVLFVRLLY